MLHDRESEKICSSDSKGQVITSSILDFMSFSTLGNNISHGLWPLCWDVCCHKGQLVKTEKACNAVEGPLQISKHGTWNTGKSSIFGMYDLYSQLVELESPKSVIAETMNWQGMTSMQHNVNSTLQWTHQRERGTGKRLWLCTCLCCWVLQAATITAATVTTIILLFLHLLSYVDSKTSDSTGVFQTFSSTFGL